MTDEELTRKIREQKACVAGTANHVRADSPRLLRAKEKLRLLVLERDLRRLMAQDPEMANAIMSDLKNEVSNA